MRQISLTLYFLLFILLNVFDFLNILTGDLDFFKKLLSWFLIAFIFYKVSFTTLVYGKRLPLYDALFVLAFCLMTIFKSLRLYVSGYVSGTLSYEFVLFKPLLDFLSSQHPVVLVITPFLLGLLLTVILCFSLLSNHPTNPTGLLASLRLGKTYFSSFLRAFFLLFFSLFFSLIVFNFFMEWFALAVDSIILVFGLLYYVFRYLHDHTNHKVSSYLRDVSNSGNDFYQKLLQQFSNINTVLIGMSFILALHFLVDAGVFLVPYLFGTQNSLYFADLNAGGKEHIPLFNAFNVSDSQFYVDSEQIWTSNTSLFLKILSWISSIILYIHCYLLFLLLLILPFVMYYFALKGQKYYLPKRLLLLFILSLLSFVFFNLFALTENTGSWRFEDYEIIKFDTTPLGFEVVNPHTLIRGIDIYTNPLTASVSNAYILLLFLALYVCMALIFYVRYDLLAPYFLKILHSCVLLFFLVYSVLFFYSFFSVEASNVFASMLSADATRTEQVQAYPLPTKETRLFRDTDTRSREFATNLGGFLGKSVNVTVMHFSPDIEKINGNVSFLTPLEKQRDYIYVSLRNDGSEDLILFVRNVSRLYKPEDSLPLIDSRFLEVNDEYIRENFPGIILLGSESTDFVYYLGKDVFYFYEDGAGNVKMEDGIVLDADRNSGFFLSYRGQDFLYIDSFGSKDSDALQTTQLRYTFLLLTRLWIDYLNLILGFIFYSVSIYAFTAFYLKSYFFKRV